MRPLKATRACIDAVGGGERGAQTRAARALRVSRAFVSRLYAGEKEPSPEVAVALVTAARAAGLDVCVHELLPSVYPLAARGMIFPE